jgi:hypothetical protein
MWGGGQAITMAMPHKNDKFKKKITLIEIPFICLNNLKFVKQRK